MSVDMAVDHDPVVSGRPWTPEVNGKANGVSLEAWAKARLEQYQNSINRLLAVEGARTIENTLRPSMTLSAELATVGQHASLLDSKHPEKDVRDMAQALTQKVSEIGTLLSLNQEVYQALSAVDPERSRRGDPPLHGAQLAAQYRLSGVDRDAATRARIKRSCRTRLLRFRSRSAATCRREPSTSS